MYKAADLLHALQDYGAQLSVINPDSNLWEVFEVRGNKIAPPVQVGLHSDAAVHEFVESFNESKFSSGSPLELAMMSFLEGVETLTLEGESAFSAILLEKKADLPVEQVWNRREDFSAHTLGDHLEWRAHPHDTDH